MTHALLRPGRSAEPPLHAPNAALLIDFDNVTLGVRSDLTKELRTLLNSDVIKGKVAVQRAYADWRRYPQYIVPLSESSIDLIFAPAFGSVKKNATDIRLAVDAIELVFTRPEIGTFILLSGDSDFSSLVLKLKEYGKFVIGVGIRESASDILVQNCDEYYSYSDLAGLSREGDPGAAPRDPWELVREAAAQMARNRDVMRSDRLKQVMQQLDPSFDERNAGFNRFSKFVMEAGTKGLLKVTKLENGQYEVAPLDGAPAPRAAEAPRAGAREEREPRPPRDEREEREEGAR
ncbi:MAG: NYN domain-containing protein, partial [Gemmatimonadales bacterium]|nr:NYN domain-containing protein [Gemmatimonadales bacterium]